MRANYQTMSKVEYVKCAMCTRKFYKTKPGFSSRCPGIKDSRAINCSKHCSRMYTYVNNLERSKRKGRKR